MNLNRSRETRGFQLSLAVAARRAGLVAGILLVATLAGGCMSLEHVLDPEAELQIYGGVRSSWAYIMDEGSPVFGSLCRVIDLPATVAMDTVLLPVSVPIVLTRGEE